MQLNFNSRFKSIQSLPIEELPNFTIITGENGSGKTHLLQALRDGNLRLDDVPDKNVAYYTWGNLAPSHEQSVSPQNQYIPGYESLFVNLAEGIREDLLAQLRQQVDASVNLDNGHLTDCVHNTGSFLNLPAAIQEVIRSEIAAYRACLVKRLEAGKRGAGFTVQYLNGTVQENYGNTPITTSGRVTSGHELTESQCAISLEIMRIKPDFFNLKRTDCLHLYPIIEERIDPFQGSLTKLFATYINERERNDLAEIRYRRGDAESFLTDEQFVARYGTPPWEVLNQVLQEAKLPFQFQKPDPNASKPLRLSLLHTEAQTEIKFSDLSSGERILISLAQFVFLTGYGRQPLAMPELILLDEVDAPLHPSATAELLRFLKQVLVERYNRRVLLTTHSPSTVALAPEESLFVMEKRSKQLRKVSRDAAIHTLTAGVPVLSVKLENRRHVFVESEYDVQYYEAIVTILRRHLSPEITFLFISSGTNGDSGCDQVRALVKQLADGGNRIVFGIVDWDKRNYGNERVRVLGLGQRYSIENYLLDPLAIAILAYQLRLVDRGMLALKEDQTFADLRDFNDAQLQLVVDNILRWLGLSTEAAQIRRACTYLNGRVVQIPVAYLEMRGHDLEKLIKGKAPNFKQFQKDSALKLAILDKVFQELPGFLSHDFLELLRGIQKR